jgi:hypothetical protein
MEHGILNLVWLAVLATGIVVSLKRSARQSARAAAERAAARRRVPAPRPVARRAEPPAPPPIVISARPQPRPQPPEPVDVFPGVDLSLPDAGGLLTTAGAGRRPRGTRRAAAFGSRTWAAGAIVGAEVLGPPLALRPGATFGAPRAF